MKKLANVLGIVALAGISFHPVNAAVRLPALISDNMVLQQQSEVSLWGWAKPGESIEVKVSWSGKSYKTKADARGNWKVEIATPAAGGAQSITLSGENTITVNNVLLGEVWLASGQSNMEFTLGKGEAKWRTGVINSAEEIAAANFPDIRMIDVPNTVSDTLADDFEASWQVCTPANANDFSAVAYYFAREINQVAGVPVGIINSTWGGTPAESWTKRTVLESDKDFRPILARYDTLLAEYPEKYSKYQQQLAVWKADSLHNKKPGAPNGANYNKSPAKLYNGMIHPLLNYKLRGVIWYQGESNANYAYQYRRLFPAMIDSWRKDFKDKNLPFYFVQIAPHKGQNPVIRESQLLTMNRVKNTGMAVTLDVGDSTDIHPRDKKTVGLRLARWALNNEYNQERVVSGPGYQSVKFKDGKALLEFTYGAGLRVSDEHLDIMIAGEDQVFHPATISIKDNKLEVYSKEVPKPKAVRYGWLNVPHAGIYNAAGLPASPFRTDKWEVETQGKN